MNNTFSTIVLVLAIVLGFLLRGCYAPSEISLPIIAVDSSAVGANIVLKDSVSTLLKRIEVLKSQGVRVITKTLVRHDTIESSPQVVTEIKTVIERDSFYVQGGFTPQTATFKTNDFLARVTIGEKLATLDSLVLYDSVKIISNEVALNKYQIQRSAVFERSNPYLSKYSEVYAEKPRYTDLGISHLQKVSRRKGLIWGFGGAAVLATTYFLLYR